MLLIVKTIMSYLKKIMNKIEITYIITCLVVLFSCTHTSDKIILKKGTAIVTGNVTNRQEGSKTIRLAAEGALEEIEHTAIIDSAGNFEVKIQLYHPQVVNLFYEKGMAKLYLRPSDSIHLEINANEFKEKILPGFTISGLGEDIQTSETIKDYLHFRKIIRFDPVAKNKSVAEYSVILKNEIEQEDSILRLFCNNNKTTPDFINWGKNEIIYNIANYIISYHFVNKDSSILKLFDKTIFPVDNDDAIVTGLYGLHLRHYALNTGLWQDTVSLKLLEKKNYFAAYTHALDKIVKKEKQGISRDIMCYKLMLDLYDKSFEDYAAVFNNSEKYFDNSLFIYLLKEKKRDFEQRENVTISFLDPETKEEKIILGNFWEELTSKYAGKIIYIDIWATWCGPCRRETPFAIDLHDYFKGKNIAFVNLCLSSDKNEWKKMIKNSNIKGDNYFFNKSQTQLLREKLKFDGYPTYLIIDKKGRLINENAPRPSSGKRIKKILNDLIDE